jgi:myxalamid-type nonribosomal peptide synthetase MxaA
LSPMQQGMLFHSLVAQEPGVYVQQHLSTFHEALHIDAFIRAWERVVARHSLLRTAFRWEGLDEPLQDVYDHIPLPLEVMTLVAATTKSRSTASVSRWGRSRPRYASIRE